MSATSGSVTAIAVAPFGVLRTEDLPTSMSSHVESVSAAKAEVFAKVEASVRSKATLNK